jgi:hypothetical protein
VWVPDERHEAMRDLVRARAAAVETLRVHRQQVSAFMLKHGRIYPRKKGWTMRYLCWLQEQQFDHHAHQIALRYAGSRFSRLVVNAASGAATAGPRSMPKVTCRRDGMHGRAASWIGPQQLFTWRRLARKPPEAVPYLDSNPIFAPAVLDVPTKPAMKEPEPRRTSRRKPISGAIEFVIDWVIVRIAARRGCGHDCRRERADCQRSDPAHRRTLHDRGRYPGRALRRARHRADQQERC